MENMTKKLLEEANKFIFVKKYEQAYQMLNELVSESHARNDLLVHLRRIELAIKISQDGSLRQEYVKQMSTKKISTETGRLCLAFLDQQTNSEKIDSSILRFKEIISENGESAAA